MGRDLSQAQKVGILFKYAASRANSAAYHTIAVATGENTANLRKIRRGENLNPHLRTLKALAGHCGIGLDYFLCETRADCQDYLSGIA